MTNNQICLPRRVPDIRITTVSGSLPAELFSGENHMNALTRDLVKLINITEENQAAKEQTSGAQFRGKLHLMPPVGWLNDPNGLCQMDGVLTEVTAK